MIWIEPCAGSLAVGLRLLGLPRLVGWMGGKGGYADAILHTLRLEPGQGADEVWLADVSDWAPCWEGLAKPGVAREAADIIEGWVAQYGVATSSQVRDLWDDLRPVWRQAATTPDADGVARWLALVAISAMNRGPEAGPAVGRNGFGPNCGPRYPCLIPRLRSWPPDGAPLRVWRDARAIPPRSGVVLLDPPYSDTQGYEAGDFARPDALALADRWVEAGAVVAYCEQVPLEGWAAVDLTSRRTRAPGRTATKSKAEWLSVRGMVPRADVGQVSMFGGAS